MKKKRKQKDKWWKKTKGKRWKFVDYHDQRLSHNIIKFVSGFKNPVMKQTLI